jgi:hypothetical protein
VVPVDSVNTSTNKNKNLSKGIIKYN